MLDANTVLTRLRLSGVPTVALSGVFDQLLAGLMVNRTLLEVTVEPLVPSEVEESSPVPPPPHFWNRLVELLEHNAVIRTFQGFGASATTTHHPASSAARASFLLDLNWHGRRALMPDGDIPAGCWPALLGRIASCDGFSNGNPPSGKAAAAPPSAVLFQFLRAKPELIRTNDNVGNRCD